MVDNKVRTKVKKFLDKLKRRKLPEDTHKKLKEIFKEISEFLNSNFQQKDDRIPTAPDSSKFFLVKRGNSSVIENFGPTVSEGIHMYVYLMLTIGSKMFPIDTQIWVMKEILRTIKEDLLTENDHTNLKEHRIKIGLFYGSSYDSIKVYVV